MGGPSLTLRALLAVGGALLRCLVPLNLGGIGFESHFGVIVSGHRALGFGLPV